mmetsp:Transcript_63386/g.137999  ORF Transcript_63386/g.137999 Transcript_63386/m.137999 type:complete len:242 (+) Transcript_63386:330-1055(+)
MDAEATCEGKGNGDVLQHGPSTQTCASAESAAFAVLAQSRVHAEPPVKGQQGPSEDSHGPHCLRSGLPCATGTPAKEDVDAESYFNAEPRDDREAVTPEPQGSPCSPYGMRACCERPGAKVLTAEGRADKSNDPHCEHGQLHAAMLLPPSPDFTEGLVEEQDRERHQRHHSDHDDGGRPKKKNRCEGQVVTRVTAGKACHAQKSCSRAPLVVRYSEEGKEKGVKKQGSQHTSPSRPPSKPL